MRTSTWILVLFVGLMTTSLTAQETTWFDANWQVTTKDNAKYYRPSPKKIKDGYWIVDYYQNGKVQMEGFSSVNTPGEENFEGLVTYYFENGTPSHEANYKDGKLHGIRKVYYESGELKEQGKYKNGKREGIWKTFYKNGKIKEKGKYKNNEKVGVWKTFYKNVY
ncbi:conserved exported hypothetical protein [Tenacibaculum litopenaei]|jgi:antitoxin component YwqK of YwqJK toxin-antitoxin module|uniref:toxin-antitoxin system YwqK family antitoxin n=1 Tax=Tenacibaculum litopenaei TaxID=396016 RepID=UPI003895A5DD